MTAPVGPHVSVYFPAEVLAEMEAEGRRLDRNIGWLVRRAWSIARKEIQKMPNVQRDIGTKEQRDRVDERDAVCPSCFNKRRLLNDRGPGSRPCPSCCNDDGSPRRRLASP